MTNESASAAETESPGPMSLVKRGRIATLTFHNPPMNMITRDALGLLQSHIDAVANDDEVLVLIIRSEVPGFFVCHAKYAELDALKTPEMPSSPEEVTPNAVQTLCERIRAMDTVSIAQVEGRATGGGAALALACDLRYAAHDRAVFNSFGVPIGTGLGGGATQYLPRAVGQSRALELILGGLDLDAATAESWGYVTRSFPADEIESYVTWISERIAACSPDVIRRTRDLVVNASHSEPEAGLRRENFALQLFSRTHEAQDGIKAFLELGGETTDGEQRLQALLGETLTRLGENK